jgi:uncharacterized protein DUF3303
MHSEPEKRGIIMPMLFMIIEHFKQADLRPVAERFRHSGRMLPDGVIYHASWIDPKAVRCFQIMEAPDPEALEVWIHRWNDLVDFEVVPVVTSADFWAKADLI